MPLPRQDCVDALPYPTTSGTAFMAGWWVAVGVRMGGLLLLPLLPRLRQLRRRSPLQPSCCASRLPTWWPTVRPAASLTTAPAAGARRRAAWAAWRRCRRRGRCWWASRRCMRSVSGCPGARVGGRRGEAGLEGAGSLASPACLTRLGSRSPTPDTPSTRRQPLRHPRPGHHRAEPRDRHRAQPSQPRAPHWRQQLRQRGAGGGRALPHRRGCVELGGDASLLPLIRTPLV